MNFMSSFFRRLRNNDAKSHEDKFKKSAEEQSETKAPPKIRRSVLKEFDPLAAESPQANKTTIIDEEEEIFEDAETSLTNLRNSVVAKARVSILIPGLQEYCPNPVNLNDTEDPSFSECVENESQIQNGTLNSTSSDDIEFNYPAINRSSLLSSTIHEVNELEENKAVADVLKETEKEYTPKQRYSYNHSDIPSTNLSIGHEDCNGQQITFVDVPSNQTITDPLNVSDTSVLDPLAECNDIHHMSVDASFNTHMTFVQGAIYIQEPMDITNGDTNIESMDISCAEMSTDIKHTFPEQDEYSDHPNVNAETSFERSTVYTEPSRNLEIVGIEANLSSDTEPVEEKPTAPNELLSPGYQSSDFQYENNVIKCTENKNNEVAVNESDDMQSLNVENVQYCGISDSVNTNPLKEITLVKPSESTNNSPDQEHESCNLQMISDSKRVDIFSGEREQSPSESVLSVKGAAADLSSAVGITEGFQDETVAINTLHGSITFDGSENAVTETPVFMKVDDILSVVSSTDANRINEQLCELTTQTCFDNTFKASSAFVSKDNDNSFIDEIPTTTMEPDLKYNSTDGISATPLSSSDIESPSKKGSECLNTTYETGTLAREKQENNFSKKQNIFEGSSDNGTNSPISESSKDIYSSFVGIENAEVKSTILASCSFENISVSESKVKDNSFVDEIPTTTMGPNIKSNSTDDNSVTPMTCSDLAASSKKDNEVLKTKYETDTCGRDKEENKSCEKQGTFKGSSPQADDGTHFDQILINERTAPIPKSAEVVSISFDGIESAEVKSTILASCSFEKMSASASKVKDNSFVDEIPTTTMGLNIKSNSTDDNSVTQMTCSNLAASSKQDNTVLNTTYETDTCEREKEEKKSCEKQGTFKASFTQADDGTNFGVIPTNERTAPIPKSAEDVSISIDGIENAEFKSTIVALCNLEKISASESKVKDNSFVETPHPYKSNSTDANSATPSNGSKLVSPSTKSDEVINTAYETDTCGREKEDEISCDKQLQPKYAELNKSVKEHSVENDLFKTEDKCFETVAISTRPTIDTEVSAIAGDKHSRFSGDSLIAMFGNKLSAAAETIMKRIKTDVIEDSSHDLKKENEIGHMEISQSNSVSTKNPQSTDDKTSSSFKLNCDESTRVLNRTSEANTLNKEEYDQKTFSEPQLKSEHLDEFDKKREEDNVEVQSDHLMTSIILTEADEVEKSIQTMASSMHQTIDAEESAIAEDLHTDSSGENLNVTLENKLPESEILLEHTKTGAIASSTQELSEKNEVCQLDEHRNELNSSNETNKTSMPHHNKLECRRSIRSKRQTTQVISNFMALNEGNKHVTDSTEEVEKISSDLASQVERLQNEVKQLVEDNLKKDKTILSHALKKESSKELLMKYKTVMDGYEKQIAKNTEDLSNLKEEYETNVRHFNSAEMAFTDLFTKYEKAKNGIAVYLKNESILLDNLRYSDEAYTQLEMKYKTMREQNETETRRTHNKMEHEREQYRQKIAKLQAMVKRLEIKASSLEVSIKQKVEECQALSALCDDITGKASI